MEGVGTPAWRSRMCCATGRVRRQGFPTGGGDLSLLDLPIGGRLNRFGRTRRSRQAGRRIEALCDDSCERSAGWRRWNDRSRDMLPLPLLLLLRAHGDLSVPSDVTRAHGDRSSIWCAGVRLPSFPHGV